MSPRPRSRSDAARRRRSSRWSARSGRPGGRALAPFLALAVVLPLLLAACGSSFDPTGPCTADGSAAGAYPDLETVVPKLYKGAPPSQVDSGRACTPTGLATLAGHGVKELRFAGATWSTGTDSGLTLATFTATDGAALDPVWMAEFYEAGARSGKNVTSVETSSYPVTPTMSGSRLDVLNGESYQSVVVWQGSGRVNVAVVADFIREIQTKEAHDAVVRAAVDAYGG